MSDPRRPLHELRELAPCAGVRSLLERVSSGQHQGDHGAGEVLAERERSGHRHERDRVHTHVLSEQRPQHRPAERYEHHADANGPESVARDRGLDEMQQRTNRDGHECTECKQALHHRPLSE